MISTRYQGGQHHSTRDLDPALKARLNAAFALDLTRTQEILK